MQKIIAGTLAAALLVPLTISMSTPVHAEALGEIYQQALKNDHRYRAASAAYLAGKEEKNIGRSALLPQIGGSYSWSDSERDITGLSEGDSVDATLETERSGYGISLTQPLFDIGAWHTYKRGKIESKIALAQYQAEKQSLIIRTAEAYFNALQAVDNFETAQAEQNANEHQLEQTRKRFEVGLTAITDVHEAQAAFDNSVARRLLQEGNVGISFEALEVLTGRSYQNLSPLKESFKIVAPSPEKREDWVDFAVKNNFGLAAASLSAESSKQLAKQSRAGHFPSVTGTVEYSDNNEESPPLSDFDSDGYEVRVTVNVPIFTGGNTSARRRQAVQRYIQAKENHQQTQRDTIQQARSLHLTVLTDVATVKARQQAITSSKSALEATQAGYEVGTRDLVDVLVAQRTLYTAQRDYSDALYTYVLNSLRLKEVAGILSEKDISELDQWLDDSRQVSRSL